jgi:hypothetical protein
MCQSPSQVFRTRFGIDHEWEGEGACGERWAVAIAFGNTAEHYQLIIPAISSLGVLVLSESSK